LLKKFGLLLKRNQQPIKITKSNRKKERAGNGNLRKAFPTPALFLKRKEV